MVGGVKRWVKIRERYRWYIDLIVVVHARLFFTVPARFSIFPRNTTVNESDVAEITCGGYGNPEPEVTWSRSEKVLSNSNRISIIDGKLRIRNVTRKDEGLYSCTVENYLQSKNISVYLTVQGETF